MFQRSHFFALLLCAFALISARPSHAKDTAAQSADRRAIAASYSAIDRSFLRGDADTFMTYFAPDFVSHSQNHGVFDRTSYETIMRAMLAANVKIVSSSTKITKFQWRGPDAVVWVDSKNHVRGPRGNLVSWESTRHYWGKINGKWQLRQEATIAYKSLLNGKPYRG